jgi:hypothetical protein
MDRGATALEVAVNIPEAAGGTLRIIVRGQRSTAVTALAPADCLCSWEERDERRVCAFAVGKLPVGEAASDVEILDSDGRRRCYIAATFLKRSDGGALCSIAMPRMSDRYGVLFSVPFEMEHRRRSVSWHALLRFGARAL